MKTVGMLISVTTWMVSLASASELPEDRARHAAVYVAARQYNRALEIYQDLLRSDLNDWQRATVQYDMASVLLQQRRWDVAVKAFAAVQVDENSSPLLRRRYYYNLGVALLGLTQSQMTLQAAEDPLFVDTFKQLKANMEQAVAAFDKSAQASCELTQIEGRGPCATPLDIVIARQRVKQLFAILGELLTLNHYEDLSLQEKLSRLLVIIGDMERWLGYIEASSHEQPSLAVEVQQLQLLPSLWNAIKRDASNVYLEEEHAQSRRELLDFAETDHEEALEFLMKGELSAGRQGLIAASYWLRAILELDVGDEIEALLKVRIMADRLGNAPKAFLASLDALTKRWLKNRIQFLPASSSRLGDDISNSLDKPSQALTLYRIAIERIGAIFADLIQISPLELPKVNDDLNALRTHSVGGRLPVHEKALEDSLEAVIKDKDQAKIRTQLTSLAMEWDPAGFLSERIGQLLNSYLLAAAHRQLPDEQLKKFGTELEQLKHFIELAEEVKMAGVSTTALASTFGKAMNNQLLALRALEAHQDDVARIFFGEVVYWLDAAQRRAFGSVAAVPEDLLTASVEEEQHAMQVVSSVMELSEQQRQSNSSFAAPLHEIMRLAQKQPMAWAAPFISAVLQHQKEVFDADGEDLSCQRLPWEQVLPVYFLGEGAADRAVELLAQASTSLSDVLNDQKVAYRKWLKALEMLREGKFKVVSRQSTKEAAENSAPKGEQTTGNPIQNTSIDQILRQLQLMDREDATDVGSHQKPVQSAGGRPW